MTTETQRPSVASVCIPLAGRSGLSMSIDLADYQALLAAGINPAFYLNANRPGGQQYVRAHLPGFGYQRAVVARLILGVGRGRIVVYANRDRLDLRRANLSVQFGRAGKAKALPPPSLGETPAAGLASAA